MFNICSLKRKFAGFANDKSGSTVTIFAISLPILIGAIAVSVEAGYWQKSKSDLQLAADTASFAGVLELRETTVDDAIDAAKIHALRNGFDPSIGTITVNSPPTSGDFQAEKAVEVIITQSGLMFFSNLISDDQIRYSVRSVSAIISGGSEACVMTLEPSAPEALSLNSGSTINATGCQVQVNSTDSEGLFANSDGDINAADICVAGGYVANSGSDLDPEPVACESSDIEDPFAYLPTPDEADDPCTRTDETIDSDTILSPGVFCDGFEINGADVEFLPGIYVFRDGEFTINSDSSAFGDDVLIFLTGDDTRLNLNSGSSIDIKGRESGPFAGMAIYQDRNSNSDDSIFNSDSSSSIEGAIYLPNSGFELNSGSSLFAASAWTILITRTLDLNSGSTITLNDNYGASDVPVPRGFDFGTGASDSDRTAGIFIVE